jgi:arsenite/tail-anchored protein-transporting ATPase
MSDTPTLIFTGKGGVGKTTVAAATALSLADHGVRTLVISTDPAHSLGDCMGIPLASMPRKVTENLDGVELDTRDEMARRFGKVRDVLMRQMARKGMSSALAEELVNFPGADELFGLLKLAELKTGGEYEAVVVDTAPTGNTLRFLYFPEFLAPVRRALSVDRAYTRTVRPIFNVLGRELPSDDFFTSVFSLFEDIERARQEFLCGSTYFRFVLVPEKLAVLETQRAVSFLNVAGNTVDAIIANKVYPSDLSEPLFAHWQEIQVGYLRQTRDSFYPLTVLEVPMYGEEVIGLQMLRSLGARLYQDINPLARMTTVDLFALSQESVDVAVMRVQLPLLGDGGVELYKDGSVLTVHMDGHRRELQCPEQLASCQILGAHREGNVLAVRFDTSKEASSFMNASY